MDIRRKLTSRKFWTALIGFITPILIMNKVPQETVTQVTSIIMAGATLIAYILAEGFTDALNGSAEKGIDDLNDPADLIGDIDETGDE